MSAYVVIGILIGVFLTLLVRMALVAWGDYETRRPHK